MASGLVGACSLNLTAGRVRVAGVHTVGRVRQRYRFAVGQVAECSDVPEQSIESIGRGNITKKSGATLFRHGAGTSAPAPRVSVRRDGQHEAPTSPATFFSP